MLNCEICGKTLQKGDHITLGLHATNEAGQLKLEYYCRAHTKKEVDVFSKEKYGVFSEWHGYNVGAGYLIYDKRLVLLTDDGEYKRVFWNQK